MTDARAQEYAAEKTAQMSDEELAVALGFQDSAHKSMLRRYIGKDLFESTKREADTSR